MIWHMLYRMHYRYRKLDRLRLCATDEAGASSHVDHRKRSPKLTFDKRSRVHMRLGAQYSERPSATPQLPPRAAWMRTQSQRRPIQLQARTLVGVAVAAQPLANRPAERTD